MKILYVDLEFDYGEPSRGINTIGQLGFKSSFEQLGHEVIPFYYDNYLKNDLNKMQKDLCQKADEVAPDLIFFMLFRDQFTIETLSYLKSKFKTANWFGDDTWRFESFSSKFAPFFTYPITTDKFSLTKYYALGLKNVIRSQWAAIDDKRPIASVNYKYDVSFVGGHNRYRNWFVKKLQKNGVSVACFGHGWPNGSLSNDSMVELFRVSKINLNLSNSASFDLRYLLTHPKNFAHTLHTTKHASQIKARNFEINYYGGFQLADYVPGLEEYYDIGKELACYSNPEEATMLIKYYLENEDEREVIRDSGMLKARASYTYSSQLKKVLDLIEKGSLL
jgi:spore maturation protein CgeB